MDGQNRNMHLRNVQIIELHRIAANLEDVNNKLAISHQYIPWWRGFFFFFLHPVKGHGTHG